jgi:uncharacterized membrane protein YraQ (UPF0718 family)
MATTLPDLEAIAAPSTRTDATRPPRVVPVWQAALAFWLLFLAIFAAHKLQLGNVGQVTTFGIIMASIVIEALPFILLGALVSAVMAVFVPDSIFGRIARLPRSIQTPGATLAGFTFPVCECGSVPIGRRLIARGIHPSAALGFMFAAPILNPIVLISTWVAYGGGTRGGEMLAGRAILGFAVAMSAALFITRRRTELLRENRDGADGLHEHDHDDGPRRVAFVGHLTGDLLFMGRYLVLGAAVSALMQTFFPQELLSSVAGTAVVATLAMMAFAFMLSLCSEADAFVATSFTAFPLSAQLGFLVLGPVLDTKLAAIYSATFKRPFIARLLIVAVPLILAGTAIFGVLT